MTDQPYAAGLAASDPDLGSGAGWVVFGAGGHARSVVDVLERLGHVVVAVVGDSGGRDWHVDQLADEDPAIERVVTEGLRAVVAIGAEGPRMALLNRLQTDAQLARTRGTRLSEHSTRTGPPTSSGQPGLSGHSTGSADSRLSGHSTGGGGFGVVPAVVAATATVAPGVVLGPGTVVLEHAHIGPASVVGSGVIVNTGAIVEHDCVVGDGVHVAPGAVLLGAASVGDGTFVGSGARVLPRVKLGPGVTVGAGAVVTRNYPGGRTVVGVPARPAPTPRGEGVHT